MCAPLDYLHRSACFVRRWSEGAIGELGRFRIAKPECRRSVEASEHFCERTTVLRASGREKLLDARRVAERCFFRRLSIRGRPQLAASLREQPHPALLVGDWWNQNLCRQQERRRRDDEYASKEEGLRIVWLRITRRQHEQ